MSGDDLRHEIVAALRAQRVWWADDTDGPADALLAGPLAPLLVRLTRIEALADAWSRADRHPPGIPEQFALAAAGRDLLRALDRHL